VLLSVLLPQNSNLCKFRKYLHERNHTIGVEISIIDIEFISEELAPWGLKVSEASPLIDGLHSVGDDLMVNHVLNLRLIQLVVLKTHDSVSHHDALDIDILPTSVLIVRENKIREIRNILPSIAFARDLHRETVTKSVRLENSGPLLKMKSLSAVKASWAVSSSVQAYYLSLSLENPTVAGD
jgi:hypothetical protein